MKYHHIEIRRIKNELYEWVAMGEGMQPGWKSLARKVVDAAMAMGPE